MIRRLMLLSCLVACTQTGLASKDLDEKYFQQRTKEGLRTNALLISKKGKLIYERYHGDWHRDRPHLLWSISKSIAATLVGQAIQSKRVSLSSTLGEIFPEHEMKVSSDIRVEDLLFWQSGIDFQETYDGRNVWITVKSTLKSSVASMLYTRGREDTLAYMLNRPQRYAAGRHYGYSSGDTQLLSGILRQITPPNHYPKLPWANLFSRIGASNCSVEQDRQGTFQLASHVWCSPDSMLKLGQFWLSASRDEGDFLPEGYMSTLLYPSDVWVRIHSDKGHAKEMPGGHFWLNKPLPDKGILKPWPEVPDDAFAALGHWGQGIYVVPSEQLVIVRTADDRLSSIDHNALISKVIKWVHHREH